ncbi:hypothetical protein Xcab_03013 [Xenorhabdus cabanillasii JM26]|nr:hypothetical protein Xcab_03013 [Xenorhabdus cabanillasii JM26]
MMNPAGKRGLINDYPTLSHHCFQITQAQCVSQIPANTLSDDIHKVMQASERLSDKGYRQSPQKNPHDLIVMRVFENPS